MADRDRHKKSALARLDAKVSPQAVPNMPRVASFHQFLAEVMRVRIQSGEAAGTYGPYTFTGRAALEEIVHLVDHILGSKTGVPLKDAKLALAGGAQFGKTTLELALSAYVSACRFLNPIVYLPDDGLADDIVDAKFRPDVIDQIGWFAQMTKIGRAVNESGKAVNTKGAFLVTDGKRKAVGMFRGLQKPPTSFTADVVIEDEKDDIKPAMAKYVSGRMTASATRFHLEIGTQRVHGAGQNKVWASGSQGVTLVATALTWDTFDAERYVKTDYGHRHVLEVPPGFINPEESWPQICRCAVTGTPRPDDPVFGWEGDFRRPGSDEVVATYVPGGHYYYAHPETGEPLDCDRPLWHHRVPGKLRMQLFTFRVAQIGTPAIDLQQIVAHWVRAVGDAEEMITFRCDRQAMPKSASQALSPEILDRARKVDPFYMSARREDVARYAGLDTGDRCWFLAREVKSAADKRLIHAAQIAVADVVSRVSILCEVMGISTLFIDERPAVSEARTLALLLNGLSNLEAEAWPRNVDWKSKETHVEFPSGLVWDGRTQQWSGLRCAVVRFTKNQLGAGIDQGAVEFLEGGLTKFVPMIACNRFESIDRVVREFLTPTENVVEVVKGPDGKASVRKDPAMRLPIQTPGAPGILETVSSHFLAGSQREKNQKTGEVGDYLDDIENHFLLANAYSGLAEAIGSAAPILHPGTFTVADLQAVVLGKPNGPVFSRPYCHF
ncbi:hypothetical protein OPIT5_08300 [Opitutaceae bacterium TAV5]|nr:hypothetical protein OPIT5_08300 [Opitutaceae bacterium TAV5]